MLRHSEARCANLKCSQDGYEFGLEDALQAIKSQGRKT